MPTERSQCHAALEDELLSTAEGIVNSCPRFRILVLGKSGAGKSSLINAAFDVNLANVSHERAGVSDIEEEITSESNPRFVLHDSQGFAAGEVQNFNIVKTFIENRAKMPDIKDKLHAVWFCMEVPTEGGALFEIADQNFLNLPLGQVPIIVVFTKYDLLERKFEKELDFDPMDDGFEELVKGEADKAFGVSCVRPLRNGTRGRPTPIPYMRVSKKPGYRDTLAQLVELTQRHIDETVWLIWAFAQRASADIKIDASIRVGRKKYWRGLASSLSFPGKTLQKCLDTIHKDIVTVWNFNDPALRLESTEFKAMMSRVVEDLVDQGVSKTTKGISVGGITGVAAIVSGVIPPAAPIAIPIAIGLVFAQWVYLVYRETPAVLRGLMGYIVDLTIVMQSLFWVMQAKGGASPVRPKLVKLALDAYLNSGDRAHVHKEIKTFVAGTSVFKRGHKDLVLDKIIQLINTNRFEPPERYKVRARAGSLGGDDEGWE